MKYLLEAFIVLISLILTVYGFYFVIIFLGIFKKKKVFPDTEPKTRFAILIAARNEAAVIGNLVDSLQQQTYPRALYDIIVIPNNCSDQTETIAIAHGAKILNCTIPVKSKGDVLQFAFQSLADKGYDAYCVFDADNLVDCHFLEAMNRAFCNGTLIAQGYRESKNPGNSWISGGYSLYFRIMNECINRPRSARNLSVFLGGTGFAIHQKCLEQVPWQTSSLVEDCEYSLYCMTHDIKIDWVCDAITYDEQPIHFGQSYRQRRRWSSGMIDVCRKQTSSLIKGLKTSKQKIQHLDGFFFLLTPLIQSLSLLSPVLILIWALFTPHPHIFILYGVIIPSVLSALGMTFFVLILSRRGQRYGSGIWKGIVSFWFFTTTWACIHLISLFNRTHVWKEIHHTQTASSPVFTNIPAHKSRSRKKDVISSEIIP